MITGCILIISPDNPYKLWKVINDCIIYHRKWVEPQSIWLRWVCVRVPKSACTHLNLPHVEHGNIKNKSAVRLLTFFAFPDSGMQACFRLYIWLEIITGRDRDQWFWRVFPPVPMESMACSARDACAQFRPAALLWIEWGRMDLSSVFKR